MQNAAPGAAFFTVNQFSAFFPGDDAESHAAWLLTLKARLECVTVKGAMMMMKSTPAHS